MRNAFWVCAKACKCQVLFPRNVPRPATCSRKVATLLSWETLAVYSRTSPARRGSTASTGGAAFFEPRGKADFAAAAFAGFAAGSASRKPGGSGDTTSGTGCAPCARRQERAPMAQLSTARDATPTVVLRLMLFV